MKELSIHQIPKFQKQVDRKDGLKIIKNKARQTLDEKSLKEKIINSDQFKRS